MAGNGEHIGNVIGELRLINNMRGEIVRLTRERYDERAQRMAAEQAADNFHHANLVYPYTKFNLPCAARGPDNPHRLIFRGFVDERTIINAEHILQAETVNVPVEQPPLRYPVMRQPPPRLVQPPPARGVQQPPVRGVQPPPARGVRPPQVQVRPPPPLMVQQVPLREVRPPQQALAPRPQRQRAARTPLLDEEPPQIPLVNHEHNIVVHNH